MVPNVPTVANISNAQRLARENFGSGSQTGLAVDYPFSGDDVQSGEPQIEVDQVECGTSKNPGQWLFQWSVRNLTERPMSLLSVRVPHGKFRAEELKFRPAIKIAAHDHFNLDLAIACQEPPNTILENAFLILLLNWQENDWRFFVRLQITIDHQGRPATTTESITVQQVGFSGISN